MFEEATPEERKIYYNEEWNAKELPDFIVDSIEQREFGFDYDGSGPSDRYNQIFSVGELERVLRNRYPYAVYSSVAYYKKPRKREGWIKAEFVFDIDAKDLPVKSCGCGKGMVCEKCLEEAKEYVFLISEALKDDFGIKKGDIRYIYSGRGYHIRVFDPELMLLSREERGKLVDYVACNKVPEVLNLSFGYPKLFRERFLIFLKYALPEDLKIKGVGKQRIEEILKKKRIIANEVEEGDFSTLRKILKSKFQDFLFHVANINAESLDAKVTVDTKRILRLPSSLHSKVSMKCVEIKNLERFSPLKHAVPKFVEERES